MAISQILDKTIQYTTLTAYLLPILSESTSSTSTKSSLQAENLSFSGKNRQKYRSECTKTRHYKPKFFFCPDLSPSGRGTSFPLTTSRAIPNKLSGSNLCPSRIPATFRPTPLGLKRSGLASKSSKFGFFAPLPHFSKKARRRTWDNKDSYNARAP